MYVILIVAVGPPHAVDCFFKWLEWRHCSQRLSFDGADLSLNRKGVRELTDIRTFFFFNGLSEADADEIQHYEDEYVFISITTREKV
jgi:hypothetical protein